MTFRLEVQRAAKGEACVLACGITNLLLTRDKPGGRVIELPAPDESGMARKS